MGFSERAERRIPLYCGSGSTDRARSFRAKRAVNAVRLGRRAEISYRDAVEAIGDGHGEFTLPREASTAPTTACLRN